MPISPGTHLVYTVQPGDTLYAIANRLGTSVPALVQANALYPPVTGPDRIFPDQVLLARLPGMSQQSAVQHQAAPGDTLYRIAERYSAGVDMLAALNRMERPNILPVARLVWVPAFVYEVEQDDSLFRISRRFAPRHPAAVVNQHRRVPASPGLEDRLGLAAVRRRPRVRGGRAPSDSRRVRPRRHRGQSGDRLRRRPRLRPVRDDDLFDRSPATPTGTLLVYTRSARNGSIQDLVEVPVSF